MKKWFNSLLLRLVFTKERFFGLAQHGVSVLGATMIAKGLATQEFLPLITGSGMGVAAIIFSAFTGGKETVSQVCLGILRHLLTICGVVATTLNWASAEDVSLIISGIIAASGAIWSYFAPEKVEAMLYRKAGLPKKGLFL